MYEIQAQHSTDNYRFNVMMYLWKRSNSLTAATSLTNVNYYNAQ